MKNRQKDSSKRKRHMNKRDPNSHDATPAAVAGPTFQPPRFLEPRKKKAQPRIFFQNKNKKYETVPSAVSHDAALAVVGLQFAHGAHAIDDLGLGGLEALPCVRELVKWVVMMMNVRVLG